MKYGSRRSYGRKRSYGRRKYAKSGVKRRRTIRRKQVYKRRRSSVFFLRKGNLPLGRRCRATLSYTQQSALSGDDITPYAASPVFRLNSLANGAMPTETIAGAPVDNRAAKFLAEQFTNYRVLGVKYDITFINNIDVNNKPKVCWVFATSDPGNNPNASDYATLGLMVQYPNFHYKVMPPFISGKPTTKLQGYFNCRKIAGNSKTWNDTSYEGSTSVTAGVTNWVGPANLLSFAWGITSVDGASAIDNSDQITVITHTKYFVEFYSPSDNGLE